ncbi:MAG TPA: calcium-binding protein, partial [Anaerolineales bacterium]|nr:calcium-binding protein [Anaerolineales bacterium]
MSIAELFYTKQAAKQASRARLYGFPPRRSRLLPRRRKLILESLEPRLLLATHPLSYAAAAGAAHDLLLRVTEEPSAPVLQVVERGNGTESVVASQPLAETSEVVITGSAQDDRLVVDYGGPLPVSFTDSAAGDRDTLEIHGGDRTWTIHGRDTGTAGSVTFAGIENLAGGPDNEDTFVFGQSGSISGKIDGGPGGFDSLVVNGSYDTIVFTPSGPDSGTVDRDGDVITYAGLEPVNTGTATNVVFSGTAGDDNWVVEDSPTAGQIQVRSTIGAIETTSFNNPTTLTINLDDGTDVLTINSFGDSGFSGSVAVNTGGGGDTVVVRALKNTATYVVDGGAGTDTINFNASSGGYTQNLTTSTSGPDTILTGADGSAVTLKTGSVEKIDDANVTVDKTYLTPLLNDMEALSDWVRRVAAYNQFASQLPFLFAGDNTAVGVGNAVEFADAIDQIRAKLHAYYNTIAGPTLTLNALETTLKAIGDNVQHYAGAIAGDFAPSVVNGNAAHFNVSLDGVPPQAVSVTFAKGDANPLTIDEVTGQINAAITSNTTLSGKILADKTADGRLLFKVVDPNVVDFTISCSAADAAFSKLGLRLSQTVKTAGMQLGAFSGTAGKLVQNANTWIGIASTTPSLNIKFPFSLSRSSTFGVDFGKETRDLKAIAFDASAQLAVTTNVAADLDLGLTLVPSPNFQVTVNNMSARVQVGGSNNLQADLAVGFLGAHVAGTVTLDAGLALDPITLSLSALQSPTISGVTITMPQHSFSADLNVSVLAGLNDGGGAFNPVGLELTLASSDPFVPSSFNFNAFTQAGDFSDLFSFSNLSASNMVTLVKKLASSLDDVANSNLFSAYKIPFAGGSLSDALDLVKTVEKALLFDDGGDGKDDGTALVTDLNSALTKAGLGTKLLAQGDGTHVSLVAIDDSITAFSASGLPAVGLNGSATLSGHTLKLTGTPTLLTAAGTLAISLTRGGAPENYNVSVTTSATADNTEVGNDVPKLLNAGGSPTFRNAQEFASRLVTLLNLDRTLILPNFNHLTDDLTYRLQLAADLPTLQFPVNFNLPLGPFGGFQSTGKISLVPHAGIDLTFGVSLGAGGTLSDSTLLSDLLEPVQVSDKPAYTGADLGAFALYGRLSGDAPFKLAFGGSEYTVTVTKSSTDANVSVDDLVADLTAALTAAKKTGGGTESLTDRFEAARSGSRIIIRTKAGSSVTDFTLTADSTGLAVRELGFQSNVAAVPASGRYAVTGVKDVPIIIGRLTSDALFTIAVAGGPSATITVTAAATAENRTVLDLLNDVKSKVGASTVKDNIEVDTQGNALVFRSKDAKTFTITAGAGADKLGLVTAGSNKDDLVITLSDGSSYTVALKTGEDGTGTPCTTIDEVKVAIERDTASKVTVRINDQQTGLLLTDDTFVAFSGTQPNPNPAIFRVEAINASAAGSKLGLIAADTAGAADKPDGKITGPALAGIALADRLFIKEPGIADPPMVHADLTFGTGAGTITATATFGFVGVNLVGSGNFKAGIGASLKDPTTSGPGDDGKITVGELANALTSDPTALLAVPAITLGPAAVDKTLQFDLSATTGIPGFNPTGWVKFTVNDLGNPFGSPATPPDIDITYDTNLNSLLNFDDLSFSQILSVLSAIIGNLADFESSGVLSTKIPLIDKSVSDLLSNVDKFNSALQAMQANPAGSLQTLAQKLTEALGVPAGLSLDGVGNKILRFTLDFSDSIRKGLSLSIPEDLLNMPGFNLSGSAGLDFTGGLNMKLDFGIDLSTLVAGSAALPDTYVYTDTAFSGTLGITGTNLNFLAGLGPLSVAIENGTASLSGSFGVSVTGSGKVALADFLASLNPTLSGSVAANLPVTFSSVSVGSISISPGTSLDGFGLDDIDVDLQLPSLADIGLFDNLLLSAEGLDTFLSGLQDLMSGTVFGTSIPLIGDQLAQGGKFIEGLRNEFVAPFRQAIEAAKNAAQDFADPAHNVISGLLFDLLGPGGGSGLNILQKLQGHTGTAQQDYVRLITNLDHYLDKTNDPELGHIPTLHEAKIEWDFTLADTYDLGPNIGFDIGLPGLGLDMDGTLNVDLDWALHLGIGFDYDEGFYLVIGDPTNPGNTNWKDLEVGLDVSFSPGASLTGKLAFLQLTAQNNQSIYTANDAAFTGTGITGTGITADFAIDLTNGTSDNHLGFAEIGNLDITAQIKAAAAIELSLSLGLNPGVVGGGVASGMPKIKADFILDWRLDGNPGTAALDYVDFSGLGNAIENGLQLVEFGNLRLDVGSFVSDVLGPIVDKVKEVTEPFQPIIDVITTPIPVISDLAGTPITLLDIAAAFGHVDAGLIYAIADIIDLVNSIPDPGATDALEIPLLSPDNNIFKIYDKADSGYSSVSLWDSNFKLADKADDLIGKVVGGIGNLKDKVRNAPTGGNAANNAAKGALTSMFDGKGGNGERGFSFPLFDNPSQVFYLLLGKQSDLALVEYRMPVLDFAFEYSQSFPIFGPLCAVISGEIGLTIDLGFGYDTRGIREFIDSKATHPELLIDGFYLIDQDQSGNDVPELKFYGGISAAAEVNLVMVEAGVGGGIGVEVDFNLHDNDNDGRVRLDELIGNIYDEAVINGNPASAPLAIFDISGQVYAELFAFLKIDLFFWQFEEEWEITPKITLVDFGIDFDRVPKLATLSASNELRLNMGPYSMSRLNGDLSDLPETFTVQHTGGSAGDETVQVTSTIGGGTQTYEHVNKVVVEGGEGVDNITLTGILSPIDIKGGAGDDVITLDAATTGNAVIRGDAGDDSITGGAGNDVIYGGLGADTIHGVGGKDIMFGDGGKLGDTFAEATLASNDSPDQLYGGGGADILFGGGGNDQLWGDDDDADAGDGGDILIGDAGTVALTSGLGNWSVDWSKGVSGTMTSRNGGADTLRGGAGDDSLFGGSGDDQLFGDAGPDKLFGESGFDSLAGGVGNDIMFGDGWIATGSGWGNPSTGLQPTTGGEADTITGGDGDDRIYGGGGNDLIKGQAGADSMRGGSGADTIYGDDEAPAGTDGVDTIYGEGEADLIHGGGANDTIYAGVGADEVYGEGGDDHILGDDGPDKIYGGGGADTIDAGTGNNLIYGDDNGASTGPEGGDSITAGNGADEIHGQGGDDIITAGDGNNTIHGDAGNDTITGWDGNNTIYGDAGNDTITAGDGNELIHGGTENDHITIGTGDSTIYGEAGDDVITVAGGNNFVYGGDDTDTITTGPGGDFIHGDAGTDVIRSGAGSDTVYGDAGNDTIYAGLDVSGGGDAAANLVFGGTGADIIYGDLGP